VIRITFISDTPCGDEAVQYLLFRGVYREILKYNAEEQKISFFIRTDS